MSEPKPKRRMSSGQRIAFFVTAWLIVLMPFLFWWNTWFGRRLPDAQLEKYLHDQAHPRHIQHALVQLGDRMARNDRSVVRWYPRVAELATFPVEEIRNTDAWVMGQDTSSVEFHQALLQMLADSSGLVRGNAALSLVRYGDATGKSQIVALLQPVRITAPHSGYISDASQPGGAIHEGGLVLKLRGAAVEGPASATASSLSTSATEDVRSPINGRLRTVAVRTGQKVQAGAQLAEIDPSTEQAWEALRALYLIGQPEDLAAILPYTRDLPEVPDRLRRQARETEQAIRERAAS